jgi:hypothetical protein
LATLVEADRVAHKQRTAERDAALLMAYEKRKRSRKRITLGADKAYDTQDFVKALREMNITPHVAQNTCDTRARRGLCQASDAVVALAAGGNGRDPGASRRAAASRVRQRGRKAEERAGSTVAIGIALGARIRQTQT